MPNGEVIHARPETLRRIYPTITTLPEQTTEGPTQASPTYVNPSPNPLDYNGRTLTLANNDDYNWDRAILLDPANGNAVVDYTDGILVSLEDDGDIRCGDICYFIAIGISSNYIREGTRVMFEAEDSGCCDVVLRDTRGHPSGTVMVPYKLVTRLL